MKAMKVSAAKVAKKRKSECIEVAKALKKAKDLPPKVTNLLVHAVPYSLGVYSDERHSFQSQTVDMVGDALGSVEFFLKKQVSDAEAKVASKDADKAARVKAVIDGAFGIAQKKGQAALKEAAIVDEEMKFQAAKVQLAEAQKADKVPGKAYKAAVAEKESLEKISAEMIAPLKAEAGSKKAIDACTKALKKFEIDETLLSTFASIAAKVPEERGDFGAATFDQLSAAVAAKESALNAGVAAAEPAKAASQAAVDSASGIFTAAKDALKTAKDVAAAAQGEVSAAEAAFKKAKYSNDNFENEMKEAEVLIKKAKKELSEFQAGPMGSYSTLKVNEKPPEEGPVTTPAAVEEPPAAE
jgi:hypothetical protein